MGPDRSEWISDVARQTVATTLGTLIAALILFLGGVLLGAIDDVPTGSIVSAAGLLLALVGFSVSAAYMAKAERHLRRAVELGRSREERGKDGPPR